MRSHPLSVCPQIEMGKVFSDLDGLVFLEDGQLPSRATVRLLSKGNGTCKLTQYRKRDTFES